MSAPLFTAIVVVCMVGGFLASELARMRNQQQPIEVDVQAEERLLELLDGQVGQWARVHRDLDVNDFTSTARRARFLQLRDARVAVLDDSDIAAIETAAKRRDHTGIAAVVATIDERVGEERSIDELDLLEAGGAVLSCSEGRQQNGKRSVIVETDDDTTPLTRLATGRSTVRAIFAAVAGGIGGAVAALVGSDIATGGVAQGAYITALAIMAVGGIAIALIDIDTFYLDYRTFWLWAAGSWGALAIAAIVDGGRREVLYGAIGAVSIAVTFEALAWLWGKLRGLTQGAGDTWIVLVSAGVPAAVVASWELAIWSVLIAAVGVFVQWSVLTAQGRGGARTPVPFGPHLVLGGVVAAAVHLILQ